MFRKVAGVVVKYRLAVFDSDGTLVDSLPWFAKAYNEVAERLGLRPVDAADQQVLQRLTGPEMLRRLQIPLWKVTKLVGEIRQLMAANISEFSLFEGIEESLARLDEAGVALGIVSSNSTENVRHILGPKNAARIRYFHCGASLFGKAPKIRGLLKAAGISAAESIYIGDELRDAEASATVGMAFGAVAWGYHEIAALRPHAAEVFRDPLDIANKLLGRSP